jgi:molybdate transport system substrate-binding protein
MRMSGRPDMRAPLRTLRFLGRAAVWSAATFAALALGTQPSHSADIRVYSSGAPGQVAQSLAATFSNATGHRILLTVGTILEIQQKLAAGDKPDVVILPAPTIDALDKTGALRSGSRIDLARVGIGVAVRAGASLPDISTVNAVRRMLIEARSIVYPDPVGGGFAGAQIARMMTRLGIAEAVKPKASHLFAIGGGTAAVAKGDVEIGLFNISEILPAKGVTLVGPLPQDLQSYIVFSGAVLAGSASPEPALAFLRSLTDPNADAAWTTGGFEPLGVHP